MSLDKFYPNRKDQRKPFYGAKSYSRGCRNHGSCPYCASNRKHKVLKQLPLVDKFDYIFEE